MALQDAERDRRSFEQIGHEWVTALDALRQDPVFIHDGDMRVVRAKPGLCAARRPRHPRGHRPPLLGGVPPAPGSAAELRAGTRAEEITPGSWSLSKTARSMRRAPVRSTTPTADSCTRSTCCTT
ncbi:MAG: hypothetical protein MZU91_08415 [Desulfosudis oleivorans]|nr:hypothetical protein [Desulfosudis oleivorans]